MKFGASKWRSWSLLLVLATLSVATSRVAMANDIVTSTPVTYMLATQLTLDTPLNTQYLPPKRYGVERLSNWYATKGGEKAKQAGAQAKVAITLGAVWPQDPTFVYARQGNIGLIEIDASQAISPRAQGVASLTLASGDLSKYVWLNSTNLTRMAAIVGEDLQRLFPQHKAIIANNQDRLTLQFRALINQQQGFLIEKGIDSVVLLNQALEDFAAGNQLFVVERHYAPQLEWSEQDKEALRQQFLDDDSLWLLTSKRPSKALLALVPAHRILHVDSLDRMGSQGISLSQPLIRWQLR